MKSVVFWVFFWLFQTHAIGSPPKGVPGITIPNAHELTGRQSKGRVFRSAQPAAKVDELTSLGVTDVLIFKNEVKTEVRDEAKALKELGIAVHKIPFQWKDIEDVEAACEEVMAAEAIVEKIAQTKGKAILFHCTAGEDRTGLLAGIFRISTQGWSVDQAFHKEMCPNGFADGNPKKPAPVAATVRNELYPVFIMAAEAVRISKSKGMGPNKKYCNTASISSLPKPYPKCR